MAERGRKRPTRRPRPERGGRQTGRGNEPPKPAVRPEQPAPDGPVADCVTGIHPVEALLSTTPGRISRLHFLKGVRSGPTRPMVARARELKIPFSFASRIHLDRVAGTTKHQGVVAQVAAVAYAELPDILARAASDPPGLVLVLDGVEDPRNLGAIIRTAEAAGAHGVIIPKRRAAPLTDLVAKTSAGAVLHLPVARAPALGGAIDMLKKGGYTVIGLDAGGKRTLAQSNLSGPIALVLGGEGRGLRPIVARHCDELVKIPLKGHTPSLNVSVAAAVGIFAVMDSREGRRER